MTGGERELPLRGGRVTPGVVRVGNSVRRPPTANSEFVHRLLDCLEAKDFEGAPRFLGRDERGRDVLSFIDGDVPAELGFYDDEALRVAASLIRRYHDLSAELVADSAAGGFGIEVMCHNDLSPCNFVFRAGAPVALIDFDAAAPGSRLHDLGYAAWLWLDLGSPEIGPPDQKRRLALFAKAYGTQDLGGLVAAILKRQSLLVVEAARAGDVAMGRWAAECRAWTRRRLNPQK